MSENLEVNQTAAFGSHGNTIIGTVNTGLSVTDAMQMALQIFREYYPQLKKEAIDELQKMLKEELEKVQPQNILPPIPRIAVPTLQGASISDEEIIRRLYAKLLAGTMNTEKREYGLVHYRTRNEEHLTLKEIGNRFGITEAAVSAIVRRKLWKHV